MLLVETYIDFSPGKGFGLFTKTDLSTGLMYWIRDEVFDKVLTQTQIYLLKKIASDYFTKYGFLEISGNWYLCGDNARFSNHSASPNTQNHFNQFGLLHSCTIYNDIKSGDEILINYTEICQTCKNGIAFPESLIL